MNETVYLIIDYFRVWNVTFWTIEYWWSLTSTNLDPFNKISTIRICWTILMPTLIKHHLMSWHYRVDLMPITKDRDGSIYLIFDDYWIWIVWHCCCCCYYCCCWNFIGGNLYQFSVGLDAESHQVVLTSLFMQVDYRLPRMWLNAAYWTWYQINWYLIFNHLQIWDLSFGIFCCNFIQVSRDLFIGELINPWQCIAPILALAST